ncbi:hypothetical protein [Hyphococcus sp.]|jgi:hypothetical protein|uniref:hypothetical protein n=1 Tax=Hyphococcus sp. TaxID=2038636 RepID=UPI003D10C5D3
MTDVITLVTALDIDAFADEQLAEPRQSAVRHRLSRDYGARLLAQRTTEMNTDLQAVKDRLYSNLELKKALRELTRRRRAPEKIRLKAGR